MKMSFFVVATAVAAAAGVVGCKNKTGDDSPPAQAAGDSVLGARLIEVVEKTGDEIVIPYRKYLLDNGLTVILHEDHSDPLVHVDVTYHVGSSREEPGKSGFAHFFEHMMFQGSKNVADEQHFRMVTEAGGTMNGTTNTDRTNYFETVPKNSLERMLWLEADRMGFLLPAVTQKAFEVQRATVKNERAESYDNKPYGLVTERVDEALYPQGHPYSWQTIGYVEDLDRVDVNDLKAFFLRWYGPNNATLTLGGDFDRSQALRWIVKYFGPIPRGPEVSAPVKPAFALDADRYISMEDNVAQPLIYMTFPTVHAMHEDEAPLDVLMSIIGVGNSSLLFKNLVNKGLAVSASANHECAELACTFSVQAVPNSASGRGLPDLERIIRETFKEFETRGVESDDLARMKTLIISSQVYGLESVAGKATQLAFYQTFFGNPNMIAKNIARYESVTQADVMRVYERYIKGKPAVVMSVVPKDHPDAAAKADNWTPPPRAIPNSVKTRKSDLDMRIAADNFDRSVTPPAGPAPVVIPPQIWREKTPNGITVLGAVSDEVPTTTMEIRIKAGLRDEPLNKLGLATLSASMLDEATQTASSEELSKRLQKLGSSVAIGVGEESTTLSIHSLTENLDETLAIAAEKLLRPKFDRQDFERIKERSIQQVAQERREPEFLADDIRRRLIYGQNNAFAHNGAGTVAILRTITLEDAKDFYAKVIAASPAEIVVVSNLQQPELMKKLPAFAAWRASRREQAPINPYPQLKGGTIYLVDMPGAAQSEIRITKRAMTYDTAGDFYKAGIVNFPLGGSFNSRLNQNLREDKGYTYGVTSGFGASAYSGAFTALAAVRSDATVEAINEFRKEIRAYAKSGMTAEELAFTRNAMIQSQALAYETPESKAGFLSQLLTYDLSPDYVNDQRKTLDAISLGDIRSIAARQLRIEDMITLVVGDKATILPGLKELGDPIVELDENGAPVSSGHRK